MSFKVNAMESQQSVQPTQKQTIPLRAAPARRTLAKILPILVILLVVGAGIFTGLVFASRSKSQNSISAIKSEDELPQEVKESMSQTFKDEAEGTIEKNDELDKYSQGTHRLLRAGGESQTAYLTSTVMDLDKYVGKKVKVFGETFGSSQVGWLMDVGKVEEL